MIWTIFAIWVLFSTVCAVIEMRTNNIFCLFMFLISIPVMFYVPFMV